MIACLDVHYFEGFANAAAIVFREWNSEEPVAQFTAANLPTAEYVSGKFYLRELAPLRAVIKKIDQPIDTIVIDGYCHLSIDRAPGLGAHLYDALNSGQSIVGVAKNRYRDTQHAVDLLRGKSKRPLFVTAIGIDYDVAARHVASMAGESRLPMLLKAVDRLSRRRPNSCEFRCGD
jgi:deoxyribonuclease V